MSLESEADEDDECVREDPEDVPPKEPPYKSRCTMYGVPDGSYSCASWGWADQDMDTDLRSSGLNPKDLLKWRWLCATGVYHAAGNTLSLEVFDELHRQGESAQGLLCRRSNLWGPESRYFDRCTPEGVKPTADALRCAPILF